MANAYSELMTLLTKKKDFGPGKKEGSWDEEANMMDDDFVTARIRNSSTGGLGMVLTGWYL